MKKILLGVLIGICVPLVSGYLFVVFGGMPVATKGKPLPMEQFLARKAQHAAFDSEAGKPSPLSADEPTLLAGAHVYLAQCVVCHGAPDHSASLVANGLFPRPPQLLPPNKGVRDDPIGEIYWKVRNGIRLTGMPGFVDGLSDAELWQVSLFLLHADELPPSARQVLRAGSASEK